VAAVNLFTVRSNVREFVGDLGRMQRRHRFAVVVALTRTAQDVRPALQGEMRSVFDRPTAYSLNAFQVVPATPETLVATVEQKSASGTSHPRNWLEPQSQGGARRGKAFETALASRLGLPIGATQFIPGKGARLDAYGNLSRGQLGQILSDLGARQVDPYQNATERSRKRNKRARHFVMKDGAGRPRYVALRSGSAVSVVLYIATRAATYRPRFDFEGVARRTAEARFPVHHAFALAELAAPRGSYTRIPRR
jgi:hypothetical protein